MRPHDHPGTSDLPGNLVYGLDRDAAQHILGAFPIVREEEEKRFGRLRSRGLILGRKVAFPANDTESRIHD